MLQPPAPPGRAPSRGTSPGSPAQTPTREAPGAPFPHRAGEPGREKGALRQGRVVRGSSGMSPLLGAPHRAGTGPDSQALLAGCALISQRSQLVPFSPTHGRGGGAEAPWGEMSLSMMPWKHCLENAMQKAKVPSAAPVEGEGCPVGAQRVPDPGPGAGWGEKAI